MDIYGHPPYIGNPYNGYTIPFNGVWWLAQYTIHLLTMAHMMCANTIRQFDIP